MASRQSAREAEYMELRGAKKDADCSKVEVKGGVSSELGCCDRFEPRTPSVQRFTCGTCEYVQIGKREFLYGGT
jgi:hypothetical protein